MGRCRCAFAGALMLGALLLVACATSTDPGIELAPREGQGVVGEWVHSGLYNRTYYLHTPPGFEASDSAGSAGSAAAERHPLLILLHGAGDTGRWFHARIAVDSATDAGGFVTVYPDGMEGTWTVGCGTCTAAEYLNADDVTFLRTLIRQLAGSLPVDSARVFVAGFSQGGQLAQLYACESPVAPAGIAVVSGSPYVAPSDRCAPAGHFPVLLVHGTQDPIIPFRGASAGGGILSAEATVQLWSGLMGCDSVPSSEEHADVVGDGTTFTTFRYAGCTFGSEVLFDRINGGGHTWPGNTGPWPDFTGRHTRNLNAGEEMVRLFLSVAGG